MCYVLLLKAILLLNFIRFLQQILQITWNNVKACSQKNHSTLLVRTCSLVKVDCWIFMISLIFYIPDFCRKNPGTLRFYILSLSPWISAMYSERIRREVLEITVSGWVLWQLCISPNIKEFLLAIESVCSA